MSPIDPSYKVCAIFGHPVGHSLSPVMHNAAFEALGLPYVYVAHDIDPSELQRAFDAVRVLGYRGLSVTIPHKVAAIEYVDEVDSTAQAIGCINTVVCNEGRLEGYNSDGLGALNALRCAGADPNGRRVTVLGSGGGARAIAMTVALEAKPTQMTLLGVLKDELERLTHDIAERSGIDIEQRLLNDEALNGVIPKTDVLLHCTPIGQHPKTDASLVPIHLLRPELSVFDIVYNPRQTKLLRDARAKGCRVIEGVEMFLGQALVQFELWTGRKPPVDVMRQVVMERL